MPNRPPRLIRDPNSKSEHYGDAQFMDEQPRLTDLVPRRLITFFLIAVAGTGVISLLEMLYVWMPRLAAYTASERVAAFDLAGTGTWQPGFPPWPSREQPSRPFWSSWSAATTATTTTAITTSGFGPPCAGCW